jgi:hypothetical protein
MDISKTVCIVCIGVMLLAVGAIAGWALHPVIKGDPSVPLPGYGGTMDCGFNAEITWHPETKVGGRDVVMHDTTWKWVFHNRSDTPMLFSIPNQKLWLIHSIYSAQFIELPETMLIDPPVTIAPGEKRVYSARGRGTSWHKTKSRECGFQIAARIDGAFHILGCAANVREAPRSVQGGADQPANAVESNSVGNDGVKARAESAPPAIEYKSN